MTLTASGPKAGTQKQKLSFQQAAPDTCLFPAPPPPTGPQGIPTPYPIKINTGSIEKKVPNVEHEGGDVANVKSMFKGLKGNNAGVGKLPPGKPTKDVISGVLTGKGYAMVGCPNCKVGGKPFVFHGSAGMVNC